MLSGTAGRESERCDERYVDRDRVEAVRCGLADTQTSARVSDFFSALADPTRVTILRALSMASLCNCDLAAILGLSESAVSHQMRTLRLMSLVRAERRGRMVYYSLSDSHVRHVLEDTLRHVVEVRHG